MKPWQEKRNEVAHKYYVEAGSGVRTSQDYNAGFNAGRLDTLERMKKVRDALEFYANDESGIDDCHIAREALKILDGEVNE